MTAHACTVCGKEWLTPGWRRKRNAGDYIGPCCRGELIQPTAAAIRATVERGNHDLCYLAKAAPRREAVHPQSETAA